MELIDTLVTKKLIVGTEERQTFTVNTAVNSVDTNPFLGGAILRPGLEANYKVALKDNITILSLGVSLPYNFILADRNLQISLQAYDGVTIVPLLSTTVIMELPFVNYEFAFGAFVPWNPLLIHPYYIQMQVNPSMFPAERANISMIGVPAALNTLTLPITCFAKISHNLALVP